MKASAGKHVLMLIENVSFRLDPRVRQEANALIHAGHKVSVICPADTRSAWKENIDNAVVYSFPAPFPGKGALSYIWEYSYSLTATFLLSLVVWLDGGFDIIHAANPPDTAVFIAVFYKVFGKRFIYDHHDLSPEMYWERFGSNGRRLVYKVLLLLEKWSCRSADYVIATNQSYETVDIKRNGVPAERISIVRNGPMPQKIHLVDPDPLLREKGRIILGFAGAMAKQDGVDYFLRALHRLIHELKRSDFYCVIIGKGSALQDLRDLAKQLDLQDHVWFTGFIPDADMLRYLSTADICIDPDPSNPFNDRCTMIKMMEYMALGKPIVAFDLPEHRVTADAAALYARPNDELEFAQKIVELMDNADMRRRMGEFGKHRIETDLNWDRQAENLIEAYDALAKQDKTRKNYQPDKPYKF
jgi:glycosyltransferase involved in cell wall biosynthesis